MYQTQWLDFLGGGAFLVLKSFWSSDWKTVTSNPRTAWEYGAILLSKKNISKRYDGILIRWATIT